jgi:DNA polymerase-3 subunit gamma/tau
MADPYQALYRRYRSKRFADLRGQEHVVRALRTAVAEDRVGHAYLFSGPRGTGKTSTARILAKVLNCEHPVDGEPDGTCPNCLAVDDGRIVDWLLELDAASNNGVANIRDLIDRIPLGTSGNRKVVILDEVHMLSTGASNALLKSLEEPPSHVVFILATTDPQKVLPTIRSRTQHFEFHLLPADELADHVRFVIADAGLELGEDAVEHVVRMGGGSARDTLSALDQVSAMGGVVAEGQPVDAILAAVVARDAGAALVAVADAASAGRDPRALGEVLIGRLRDAFLAVMGAPDRHLPAPDLAAASALGEQLGAPGLTRALEVLGEALVELAKKPDPRIVLEVALVRLCRPDADRSLDAVLERLDRLERGQVAPAAVPAPTGADAPSAAAPTSSAARAPSPPPPPRSTRPADGAREELARATGARPGPVRPPARKATAPSTPPAAAPPAAAPPAAEPEPASAPTAPSSSAGEAAPAAPLDRTTLEQVWATTVLPGLKPGTKAVFGTGTFAEPDGATAVFALANGPTRDHCEKKRPEVEAALAAALGRPVVLRLVTDAEVSGLPPAAVPSAGAPPAPAAAPSPADDDEAIDVHDLEDAPDAGSGVERLAEAFPGAELVDEP